MADQFSDLIDYPANGGDEETEVKCLGDFANKYDAEVFRKRIARVLDTGDDLPVTAMCLWEVILHIRDSNTAIVMVPNEKFKPAPYRNPARAKRIEAVFIPDQDV